jgi:tRNA pseudouridine38-40 synthase
MIQNFRLLIEYDGTNYAGWQRQKNDPTIQGEIEKALETMLGQKVSVIGSGRTDAGVHALGQVANFRCDTRLSPEAFQKGLNSLLNKDIVIKGCKEAEIDFHARFNAKGKRYSYRIFNHPVPCSVGRQYCWWVRFPLDTGAMQLGSAHLIGTHDFKAFEGAGSPRAHTIRTVSDAQFRQEGEYLIFDIEADGFLRFMVRNIVGTLVSVGLSKFQPDDVKRILLSENRANAGITAPSRGLFLIKVRYE